ncbi:MAG: helix-turn-helix transcriptional regulator [Pseudomonadales bacterium]
MLAGQDLDQLLGSIYEGPLEERPWQAFLRLVRGYLNADIAALFLQPPSPQGRLVMLLDGGRSEGVASYAEGLFSLDPFVDLPAGEIVTLREFVPQKSLLESEFYRLSLAPNHLSDFLGADLSLKGEFDVRFRLSRYDDKPFFGEREKRLCAELIPHLERSIRIHARLNRIESERNLYAGAVEQLAVGSIVLDETGRALNTNDKALELLQLNDGLSLVDGKLHLGSATANTELQRMLALSLDNQREARASVVDALRVPRPSGAADFGLIVRPVPVSQWSEGRSSPSIAIFISDPESSVEATAKTLVRLFGFTPTEAELALLLANGLSLDEAAENLGVSRNTIRTHLRALFSKTGVSRQTLLVRLILNSVASLA